MPRAASPTPEKFCLWCGERMERKRYGKQLEDMGAFLRRKFCSHKCAGMAHRKSEPTKSAIGKRLKKYRGNACEQCGSISDLGIHHIDGDRHNNTKGNLMTLCVTCHTKWHWENGKTMPKRQSVCKICGAPARKLDMCQKHYARYRKYGNPYLTKKWFSPSYVLWDELLSRPA